MNIKLLHETIKELRAELDRVNLAIQQIEMLARSAGDEQEAGRDSRKAGPPPAEPGGKGD